MTNQEAKFILHAYRHGGGDASDSHFQEALEHARRDPDLTKWFAEETALDGAISRQLKAAPIPSDLRVNILAGRKIVEPTNAWRRNTWIAAAACFAILSVVLGVIFSSPTKDDFTIFRSDMAEFLTTKLDRLDVDTSDMGEARRWLADHKAPDDFVLPEGVENLRGLGCRIVDWHGEKVTLVCFKLQGPQEIHLFVVDRAKFREVPPESSPQFAQSGAWMTASWSRGDKVYLLAGIGDRAKLQKYL